MSKNKLEAGEYDLHVSMLMSLAVLGYIENNLIPALECIGIRFYRPNTYLDGFVCEYVSCIEQDILYIYGYRHPVTRQVRVIANFDSMKARKAFGEYELVWWERNYLYITYGGFIARGLEAALTAMQASLADRDEYLQYEAIMLNALRNKPKPMGALMGLYNCYAYLFGFKSLKDVDRKPRVVFRPKK